MSLGAINSNLDFSVMSPQGSNLSTEQILKNINETLKQMEQLLSDAFTVRAPFNGVSANAGLFVTLQSDGLGSYEIIPSTAAAIDGFLVESVVNGQYTGILTIGINRFLSGLIPGTRYYADVAGGITSVPGTIEVGFAISDTELLVRIRKA